MMRTISFDHRINWQGGSPSEHGSQAELCFKARLGRDTVICRVPHKAILNALHARAIQADVLDIDDEWGEGSERRICESLFREFRPLFRDLARQKILAGAFALPFGVVRSVLLDEIELHRIARQGTSAH
jgi:hypothetical protein